MPKVMLVEDDNNLREIYEARLQAEGYEIVSAKDGEEALVVAKAEMPDLVISDVMMPKISGFEMLDILRNTDGLRDVKVIMLTALGQSDDQQRADKLGADRYLVKSQVTLEDIVNVAHQLLGEGAVASDVPQAAPQPATPEPMPMAVAPTPTELPVTASPEPTSVPTDVPSPQPIEDPAVSAAGQVTEDADVESFVAGASNDPAPAPSPVAIPVTSSSASDGADQALSAAADSLMSQSDSAAQSTPQNAPAGQMVINPLESVPKPDIIALAAAEEAKEQAQAQAGAPKPDDKKIDPNSIAL
jgi:CheY-like chemotaxis protein